MPTEPNVFCTLPEVRLAMFDGAPATPSKVTLCTEVGPAPQSNVTTVFRGTEMESGVKLLFLTCTVVTIAAVVSNVSAGAPGNAAAVAVAVCTPNPAPSVREALALGTPVVASRTAFRPRGATLFDPGDAAGMAVAVELALEADKCEAEAESGSIDRLMAIYRQSVASEGL